jgi:hypothetical protein
LLMKGILKDSKMKLIMFSISLILMGKKTSICRISASSYMISMTSQSQVREVKKNCVFITRNAITPTLYNARVAIISFDDSNNSSDIKFKVVFMTPKIGGQETF